MLLNLLLLIGGELGLVYRLGCGGGWLNTGLLLEVCLLLLQLGKFGFLFLNLPELFSSSCALSTGFGRRVVAF